MAGVRGFEPLKAEPESAVIPLHHTPKINDLQYLTILHERSKGVKLGQIGLFCKRFAYGKSAELTVNFFLHSIKYFSEIFFA